MNAKARRMHLIFPEDGKILGTNWHHGLFKNTSRCCQRIFLVILKIGVVRSHFSCKLAREIFLNLDQGDVTKSFHRAIKVLSFIFSSYPSVFQGVLPATLNLLAPLEFPWYASEKRLGVAGGYPLLFLLRKEFDNFLSQFVSVWDNFVSQSESV